MKCVVGMKIMTKEEKIDTEYISKDKVKQKIKEFKDYSNWLNQTKTKTEGITAQIQLIDMILIPNLEGILK